MKKSSFLSIMNYLWVCFCLYQMKKNAAADNDKEIVFSKAVKAGKRIYYLDVKKNRKGEMFLAITESKKIVLGEGEASQVSFEKHKIFLYKEDFEKFLEGLKQTMQFIEQDNSFPLSDGANPEKKPNLDVADEANDSLKSDDIKIDIDF